MTPEQQLALIRRAVPPNGGGSDDRGDDEAMFELVALLSKIVMHEARRALLRFHQVHKGAGYSISADDLRQEALAALFEKDAKALRCFDPSRGSLHTYVSRIARRRLFSYLALRAHTGTGEEPTYPLPDPPAFDNPVTGWIVARFTEELRLELSDPLWETFMEFFVKGTRPAEIARSAGCSVPAVHLRVWNIRRRSKKILRKILDRSPGADENTPVVRWLRSFLAAERGD